MLIRADLDPYHGHMVIGNIFARAKIFLQCERPALALEDMKEVFAEAPDDFRAHCTYVSRVWELYSLCTPSQK